MPLTWKEAREITAQFTNRGGKTDTAPGTDTFTYQVLQYLLYEGEHGSERKFSFCAYNGAFTIPYELEVPLKVKIDNKVGSVWDRWFEWHQGFELDGCIPQNALFEDPNYYPTVYDVCSTGSKIGILGTCTEDETAHVVIKGKDLSGRQIITSHKGEQVIGEYLTIQKGQINYTKNVFGTIDEVYKTITKGYTQLYAVNPDNQSKTFLADYEPYLEKPQYRRFTITSNCPGTYTKITVLGRIRLKPKYADEDLIPFENRYAIFTAAQMMNKQFNGNLDQVGALGQIVTNTVTKENEHKKINNGQPIEVFTGTSPGRIQNTIITGAGRMGRYKGLWS